ncbi:MAG: hypothetical protein LBC57_01000 [Treponema sp.]|nr:hypothetical protein [Treponema sp.]
MSVLAFILTFSTLFFSCGELDTVLPTSGTYRVNALVNNQTLDDCAVIRSDDQIQPFFANSVANDPDVSGLTVFLKDSGGAVYGKTLYTLKPDGTEWEGKPNDGKIIHVSRLDRDIPYYNIPEDLNLGTYIMVFQIMGEKDSLYQIERQVYYLNQASFSLVDIRNYLPGLAGNSSLAPPGVTIMLEAQAYFDSSLDPYIIWYNGRKKIGEGRVIKGANRFMWKAPEQTGFLSIRAELFPFMPVHDDPSVKPAAGAALEMSVAVSSKGQQAYFERSKKDLLHLYQFWGNLQDSLNPTRGDTVLVSPAGQEVRWAPADGIYGLALAEGDSYIIPDFPFNIKNGEGNGQILFHFKTLAEGHIMKFSLGLEDSSSLDLDLSYTKGMILLSALPDASPLLHFFPSGESFVDMNLGFAAAGNTLMLYLGPEKQEFPPESTRLNLSAALSGKGSLTLHFVPDPGAETANPAAEGILPGNGEIAEQTQDAGNLNTGNLSAEGTAEKTIGLIVNELVLSGFSSKPHETVEETMDSESSVEAKDRSDPLNSSSAGLVSKITPRILPPEPA